MAQQENKPPSENPLTRPLILVLCGVVFSYLGGFYFREVPVFNFFLLLLGVALPIAAIYLLWQERHKF